MTELSSAAARTLRLRELGVLTSADVHVTETLVRLTGRHHADAELAVSLAVRAPRLGHVCLDLRRIGELGLAVEGRPTVDEPLPPLHSWMDAIRAAPSVRLGDEDGRTAPLVLDGHRLYLDRYWRYEQRLVGRILDLLARPVADYDQATVSHQLDVLFPGDADTDQRRAAEVATRSSLTVLTGGPGTGKTTTVVRLLATLWLSTTGEPPSIVLAAPTGKAAARLAAAIRSAAGSLPIPAEALEGLQALETSTLHRLLGWRPSNPTRFRHHADSPLPHDVVVVDEASMASLPLMAKLLDALGPHTQLVLVGDRDQLASVDAGAVLSDICGPRDAEFVTGPIAAAHQLSESIVTLRRFHRFGADSGIGAVARAVQRIGVDDEQPAREVLELLRGDRTEPGGPARYADVSLAAPSTPPEPILPPEVLDRMVAGYAEAVGAALAGADPRHILDLFERQRVLSALRRGPDGVQALTDLLGERVAEALPGYRHGERFPVGQPVMASRNEHRLGLYNGDVGVIVRDAATDQRRAAFHTSDGGVRLIAPARLPDVEPVFAMSVHKSQGSQFDDVVLVLPRQDSVLLNRELVYTGITRGARRVTVVASEHILVSALGRQVQRASGLSERLWRAPGARVLR